MTPSLRWPALKAIALFGVAASIGFGVKWAPELFRRYKSHNESSVRGATKTIATAQVIFRDGIQKGGAGRYATLAELGDAGLIDAVLATGTKDGYVFTVAPSPTTSEFLWFAMARPLIPRVTGERSFFTNHAGCPWVMYDVAPIASPTETCEPPPGFLLER